VDNLASALRRLIEDRHGRSHGATKDFYERVCAHVADTSAGPGDLDVGQALYKRLGHELNKTSGRPSWQVVEWVVDLCPPVGAEEGWQHKTLEEFAGRWQQENNGRAPDGYLGRIVRHGKQVRAAVTSSAEAADAASTVRLLQKELAAAEELLAAAGQRHAQSQLDAEELTSRVGSLQGSIDRLEDQLNASTRDFAEGTVTLIAQLGALREEKDAVEVVNARLRDEIDNLRAHESRLRSDLADVQRVLQERTRQLDQLSTDAVETQRRQQLRIEELQGRIADLQSPPQPEPSGDRQSPIDADALRQGWPAGDSTADAYAWQDHVSWIDPRDLPPQLG
jgi:hypothetical protein